MAFIVQSETKVSSFRNMWLWSYQVQMIQYSLPHTYEARTLLGLGVSRSRTHVVSDTNTYNYTKLCYFLKLLAVSAY